MSNDVAVREATSEDRTAVLGVLDAAALETDADRVRASIERGGTLVAVRAAAGEPGVTDATGDGPVLGALVLEGTEVRTVAVRRRLRGQGVGTALVAAAAERRDGLVATFDERVRPFYEALGFEVEPAGNGRYRGRLPGGRVPGR